ncbi:MAG: hypothetical protein DRP45_00330 [Candidatus Zixiibacteriota bacterium]|nr:MAG: hypothetical protein DRP45_00330 [candidate division Zixibacteria bacterium]
MNGRTLTVVLMSLAFIVACFVSGPALSGEHPWDEDVLDLDTTWYNWDDPVDDKRDTTKTDTLPLDGGGDCSPSVQTLWFEFFRSIAIGSLIGF